MLTPADIDGKQFSTTRLKEGYDQNEVDSFLDEVQEAYAVLYQQAAMLEEENRTLRRKVEASATAPTAELAFRPDPPSVVAEKLLEAAQQAHDAHVADAKAKAEDVVREAGAQGAKLVEEAQAAAERIKAEGLAEKYRRNDELDKKIDKAQRTLGDLDRRGQQVRRALGDMINSYDSEFPS